VAIPDSDVQVNLGAGRAEMHVQNLPTDDYFKLPNALADGPEIDATISFDVVWSIPISRRLNFQNSTAIDPFAGEFVENQATVSWSASNENGFSFTSNPGNASTSVDVFNELSHVSNGIFFDALSADTGAALEGASSKSALSGGNIPNLALGGTAVGLSSILAINGVGQPLTPSNLKNPVGTSSNKLLTALASAQQSAFEFVWDPIAASLVTKS
jgi:hypothetical protein